DANKTIAAVIAEAPGLLTRAQEFKAYDPEAKKAVAALEGLAKLVAKQPAVAVMLKPLTEARAAMEALAQAMAFVKAKAAAEEIVKRAASVEAEAKAQGAAGDLADTLASKPLDAADGFDDDLAAVRKQFGEVDGHAAKEAVKEA